MTLCGLLALAPAASVGAQAKPAANDAALATVQKTFSDLNGWVTTSAKLVPAERYSYKPSPSVRTYAQLIAHSVDGYKYFCALAAGRKVEWSDATEKGALDRATLLRALDESVAECRTSHSAPRDIAPLIQNIGHASLHYGNIITYLRMMGLTPPSS